MEQHIQSAIDSPLLQRVSKVREHMGLAKLPTEILASELDPFLLHLVRKDADDPEPDVKAMLEDQQGYWLSFDKWHTFVDWNKD